MLTVIHNQSLNVNLLPPILPPPPPPTVQPHRPPAPPPGVTTVTPFRHAYFPALQAPTLPYTRLPVAPPSVNTIPAMTVHLPPMQLPLAAATSMYNNSINNNCNSSNNINPQSISILQATNNTSAACLNNTIPRGMIPPTSYNIGPSSMVTTLERPVTLSTQTLQRFPAACIPPPPAVPVPALPTHQAAGKPAGQPTMNLYSSNTPGLIRHIPSSVNDSRKSCHSYKLDVHETPNLEKFKTGHNYKLTQSTVVNNNNGTTFVKEKRTAENGQAEMKITNCRLGVDKLSPEKSRDKRKSCCFQKKDSSSCDNKHGILPRKRPMGDNDASSNVVGPCALEKKLKLEKTQDFHNNDSGEDSLISTSKTGTDSATKLSAASSPPTSPYHTNIQTHALKSEIKTKQNLSPFPATSVDAIAHSHHDLSTCQPLFSPGAKVDQLPGTTPDCTAIDTLDTQDGIIKQVVAPAGIADPCASPETNPQTERQILNNKTDNQNERESQEQLDQLMMPDQLQKLHHRPRSSCNVLIRSEVLRHSIAAILDMKGVTKTSVSHTDKDDDKNISVNVSLPELNNSEAYERSSNNDLSDENDFNSLNTVSDSREGKDSDVDITSPVSESSTLKRDQTKSAHVLEKNSIALNHSEGCFLRPQSLTSSSCSASPKSSDEKDTCEEDFIVVEDYEDNNKHNTNLEKTKTASSHSKTSPTSGHSCKQKIIDKEMFSLHNSPYNNASKNDHPSRESSNHLKRLQDLIAKNDEEHFNKDEFFNAKAKILKTPDYESENLNVTENAKNYLQVQTVDDVGKDNQRSRLDPQIPMSCISESSDVGKTTSHRLKAPNPKCKAVIHPFSISHSHQSQKRCLQNPSLHEMANTSHSHFQSLSEGRPCSQRHHHYQLYRSQQLYQPHPVHYQYHNHLGCDHHQDILNAKSSAFTPILRPPWISRASGYPNQTHNTHTAPGMSLSTDKQPIFLSDSNTNLSVNLDNFSNNQRPQANLDVLSPGFQKSTNLDSILLLREQSVSPSKNNGAFIPNSSPFIVNKNNSPPILSAWLNWAQHRCNTLSVRSDSKELMVGGGCAKKTPSAPRYHCESCNKTYSTFGGLSKHRQFHCLQHVKKEFGCKFCTKSYSSLGALKMHVRTHTLPCKCHVCGKAFSRPWLLQGHVRTHTGEKPFRCNHCGRAFADRSNLRAHLQTHADIKKYACVKCGKTFSRMSLLNKHSDGSCPADSIPCV